jgi:hypothetical protein
MTDLQTQEQEMFECCVCLDENVCADETTDCGHAVCQGCLARMHTPTCPMCRAPIELVGEAAERLGRKEMARKRTNAYLKPYNRILFRRMASRIRRRNGNIYINLSQILQA